MKRMLGPVRVWSYLPPPKPSFGASLPSPLAPHSQSEKPGEALESLRGETANPVVGEISRKIHTRPQQATWLHTEPLVRDTQVWLVWEQSDEGEEVGGSNVCPQPVCCVGRGPLGVGEKKGWWVSRRGVAHGIHGPSLQG